MTHELCWYQHYFNGNQELLLNHKYRLHFHTYMISNSFNFVWVFKSYFNKHYWWCQQNWILWTWSKGYYVIISVHDFTSKALSHDSSRIVDVVMWPKFGNSCISMREVIITSILQGFDLKKHFFSRVLFIQVQQFRTGTRYDF